MPGPDEVEQLGNEESENDLEQLGGDIFEEPEKPEDKEPVKTEEIEVKPPVEKEEEKEEDKEKEEEPKEVKVYPRPSIKQIEEKYPEFFKTFPDLRHAIAREQKYTELYPTLEDATEAKDQSETYEFLRDEILRGNVNTFLDSIKEVDSGSYKKFVGNFMQSLYTNDKDTYYGIVDPILGNVLRSIHSRATDENTRNAALVLSNVLFGNTDIAEGKRVIDPQAAPKKSQEQEDFERDKQKFQQERFASFQSDVEADITSDLKDKIRDGIDPDGVMNDELIEMLVDKAFTQIDKAIASDKLHAAQMSSLWKRGFKAGLSNDWKTRIKSAYLARAEHLIPSIRAKVRETALGAKSKSADRTRSKVEGNNRTEIRPSAGSPSGNKNYKPRDIDYSRTSDMDILEDRVTLRR